MFESNLQPQLTELALEDDRDDGQEQSAGARVCNNSLTNFLDADVIDVLSSSDDGSAESTPMHAQMEDDSDVEVVCVKESQKKKKAPRYAPPMSVDPSSRLLLTSAGSSNEQSTAI